MTHILVIENSPLMRPTLRDLLQCAGYEVFTAVHMMEALSFLEEGAVVDLIVMDFFMPDINGIKALRSLRTDERYENIPVVVFAVSDDLKTRQHALSAGANAFLGPPIMVTDFMAIVNRLVISGQDYF